MGQEGAEAENDDRLAFLMALKESGAEKHMAVSHRFRCLHFNRTPLLSNFPRDLLEISSSRAPRADKGSPGVPRDSERISWELLVIPKGL